jgi:hypothetical protein
VSTPSSRAGLLRGGLVGACSALITALAHGAGGGGTPAGSVSVELMLVCSTVGAGVGALNLAGRRARVGLVIAALCLGQALGHLTLAAFGGHHHGAMLAMPPMQMLVLHAVAAVALGLLIAAVEHLYVVLSSIVSWLRIFACGVLVPTVAKARFSPSVVVVHPVLEGAGLGMRAPPTRFALGA